MVESGYGSVISDWTKTGSTDGLKALSSNKAFMQKYLKNTLEKCNSEAFEIVSNANEIKANAQSLLSIGCGNALVEMFIARQIRPSFIYLFDIEETPGKHHHGVNENGAGYSSLKTARKVLELNLNYQPVIVSLNPLRQNLPSIKVDITISLFSAGFHYSMNQYRDFLMSSISPGGMLIFDERNNSSPDFRFNCDDFTCLKNCSTGAKHERKLMIKK